MQINPLNKNQNYYSNTNKNTNFKARLGLEVIRCSLNSAQKNRLENIAKSLGDNNDYVHVIINDFTDFNAQVPQFITWVRCKTKNKVVDDGSFSAFWGHSSSLKNAMDRVETTIYKYFRQAEKG